MIRHHFVEELEALRADFLGMGEKTLEAVGHAIAAVQLKEGVALERAQELEAQIDGAYRRIHNQALLILTLQAPVASDARLIAGILESIVDLEEIGDNALEVSEIALAAKGRPNSQTINQLVCVAERSREALTRALDSWRDANRDKAVSVRADEVSIRAEGQTLIEKLYQLTQLPGNAAIYVDLVLICRHFARMSRHAVSIAEQAGSAIPTGR